MSAQRLTGQPRAIKAEAVEAHGSGGGPQSPGEHECRGQKTREVLRRNHRVKVTRTQDTA